MPDPTDQLENRSTEPPRTAPKRIGAVVAAVGLAASVLATPTLAQSRPSDLSPEGFADIILPVEAVEGEIVLSARRAWTWRTGGGVPTQRLVLEGDVTCQLGGYEFSAERAAVWLQRLDDGAGPAVYQVFAVLDKVDAPAADARIAVVADRLPVQGIVETTAPVRLIADLRESGRPPLGAGRASEAGQFLAEAESDFQLGLARAIGLEADLPVADAARPGRIPLDDTDTRFEPSADTSAVTRSLRAARARAARARAADRSIFVGQGVFSFSVGDRAVVRTDEDNARVVLTGGVIVQYNDARSGEGLELKAERAVVYLAPGSIAETLGSLDADKVEGIYLEGEVLASDGTYTLRGPRIYYDVRQNRALILDAVFWTYEQRTGMPLYLRADAIRQESRQQFTAKKARLANTAFFNPHFTLGVRDVAVTIYDEDQNDDVLGGRSYVDARNMTLQGAQVPLMWWPRYRGDPEQFPLRDLRYVDSNRRGAGVQSSWNAFSLLGIDPGGGQAADLDIDYYADSGIGLGLRAQWDRSAWFGYEHEGAFSGYILPDDRGDDIGPTGRERERDGDLRGYARAEERIQLAAPWELLLEASWVSDPLFLESYFPREGESIREITNRAHLRRQDEDSVFHFEIKGTALGFIPNQVLLQSPGYVVDKLPEIGYVQVARDVLPDSNPGFLTHTWEASYSNMRLRFSEVDARSYGYELGGEAMRAFGTGLDTSLGDAQRAAGLGENFISRVDTRHEVNAQFEAGPVKVTPFVVGRLTAYDTEFSGFNDSNDESMRLWAAAGVHLGTELTRIYRGVDNRLFDLYELRHIIEPSLSVWAASTNVDQEDLPVYDDDIENLGDDAVIRVGLDQTFQTKRGGPGRWRTVDVLTIDMEYVYTDGDDRPRGPIGRYFEARPELSNPGDFGRVASVWRASEVVAITGETIFDFEANQQARSSAGLAIQHRPGFITSVEWRYINPLDVAYLTAAARYTLTDKYQAVFSTDYNFDEEQFQRFRGEVLRAFPNGVVGITLGFDAIRSETSFGFVIRPFGLRGTPASGLGSARNAFGG